MVSLDGRYALVTGGGSGIGAAIAVALARAGTHVTICGRRLAPLQDTAKSDARIRAVVADVTDEETMTRLHAQARAPFDIVIANAGMAESAPAPAISLDLWNRTLAVNLTGAFLTVKPALAGMRKRGFGRIVFIASTAGLVGFPYVAAYVAAKHGVVGLMRALAAETAGSGVAVNAICPGFADTPMLSRSVDRIVETTGRSGPDARAMLAASNPQGRLVRPAEVADTVLRFCQSEAPTGQAITLAEDLT